MRITDFPELIAPTGNDLLVTVDIANDLTKKVKLDNLPISLPALTALATKQDSLVSGTNIKTVNSNSLLGSGDVAVQETLVSGTNIKTLNSVSLLGSGDIVLAATPSGVAGAIQFSNGSAFASDATNFFWDDTNNRLGVGTNAPASQLEIKGNDDASFQISGGIAGRRALFSYLNAPSVFEFDVSNILRIKNGSTYSLYTDTTGSVGIGTLSPTARLHAKGGGTTSATTSLLVQNSAGALGLRVTDDLVVTTGGTFFNICSGGTVSSFRLQNAGNQFLMGIDNNHDVTFNGFYSRRAPAGYDCSFDDSGNYSGVASSLVTMTSTTRGFLPPRMTTTQKNAIASPATGLMVMDITTLKLCVYNGSSWVDLH
jgi:hypothetical protein